MTPLEQAAQLRSMAAQLEASTAANLNGMPTNQGFANLFQMPTTPPPAPAPLNPTSLEVLVSGLVEKGIDAKLGPIIKQAQQAITQAQQQAQAAQAANPAGNMMMAFSTLIQASLKPDEVQWVQEHVAGGSPGWPQFLQSETLRQLIQMGYEEYRKFLAGQKK
jgi:hypothetical protein